MVIAQPEVIQNYLFPLSEQLKMKILEYRSLISSQLSAAANKDKDSSRKLLIITGPQTIKSPIQAKYCSQWISKMFGKRIFSRASPNLHLDNVDIFTSPREAKMDSLVFAMKANMTESLKRDDVQNKPMMSTEIYHGIPLTRTLMHELAEFCPLTVYLSNTITPQYISDLCCLGLIEKGLVECQLNREIVSGVSYPVGYEADLDNYRLTKAGEAMLVSRYPHSFLTVTKNGTVAHVETCGNDDTFLVISVESNKIHEPNEIYELFDGNNNSLTSLFEGLLLDIATMSIEEMNDLICDFKKMIQSMKQQKMRIMFDMGDLRYDNYNYKAQLAYSLIMDDFIYGKTIGFVINSGDFYLPAGTELFEVKSDTDKAEYADGESTTYQFNNLKKSLLKHNPCYEDIRADNQSFKLANELIELIAKLNYSREDYKSKVQSEVKVPLK